jgi:hypothetical protein
VIVTDGDPLVNTAAWAAARFYRRELAGDELLSSLLQCLAGEARLRMRELPRRLRSSWQKATLQLLGLHHFAYPDLIVLQEIDPAVAMRRIRARGGPLQVHETEAFLAELGRAYDRVCRLLAARRGVSVLRIRADQTSEEACVQRVTETLPEYVTHERETTPDGIEVIATTMSGSLQDQRKVDLIEPEFRSRTQRAVHVSKADTHVQARAIAHEDVARVARDLLQRLVVLPALGLVCRPFRVEGGEHAERVLLPALLIANHASHLNTPSILRALSGHDRRAPAPRGAARRRRPDRVGSGGALASRGGGRPPARRPPAGPGSGAPGSGAAELGPDARRGRD